ncbi:MAG: chorismate synthase, partial [Oscillospiraceae bacterium]|nr:chorismate synthase [Oscillospiraceae bacterium]
GERMKIEQDKIKINSGIRFSKTTASPICIEIENKDWQNWNYNSGNNCQYHILEFSKQICKCFCFCPYSSKADKDGKCQSTHNIHNLWDCKAKNVSRQFFQSFSLTCNWHNRDNSITCGH